MSALRIRALVVFIVIGTVGGGRSQACAQSYWDIEALAALSRVPIGALPGTSLEATVPSGRRGVLRLGATPASELLGSRLNIGASLYLPGKNGSRTLTIGATGGCSVCAKGLMIGDDHSWRMRGPGPDSSHRTWLTSSIELGVGRAMKMTPIGVRLGVSAIRVGLPRGAAISVSPGVVFGGYLYPKSIFKPELGKPVTGGVLKSLRVATVLPMLDGRISLGGNHLFVLGARTTIGLSYTW